MYDKYVQWEFAYDAHCIVEKLTEKGKCEPHMAGVEIYKILIEITKILLFNELEILFLVLVSQKTQ